jgi:hypothetical protein
LREATGAALTEGLAVAGAEEAGAEGAAGVAEAVGDAEVEGALDDGADVAAGRDA